MRADILPPGRIADIEVLRAFAVLYVILHHANGVLFALGVPGASGVYAWFGGWVGVDLFFAISGFVIARTLLLEFAGVRDPREFVTRACAFWIRRAFRLLPLAWAWLGIVLLLSIWFNDSGVFGSVRANLEATAAGVLQYANWRFSQAFGRFEYGASFVYWSLSLEEQFYLVLPLALLVPRRALVLALLLLTLLQIPSARGVTGMAFRTDALCLGVLLAMLEGTALHAQLRERLGRVPLPAAIAFVSLLAMIAIIGSPKLRSLSFHVGLVSLCAALVVLLASLDAGIIAGVLPRPVRAVLLWLGARSYALYLVHVPAYFLIRESASRTGHDLAQWPLLTMLIAAMLIGLLSEAGFRVIELPCREHGRRVAARWVAARGSAEPCRVERCR